MQLDILKFHKYNLHYGYQLANIFGIKQPLASLDEVKKYKTANPFMHEVENRILKKNRYFGSHHFKERNFSIDPMIFDEGVIDLYVEGYFQSYRYIDWLMENKLSIFQFQEKFESGENEIFSDKVETISVHIRGGDYIHKRKNRKVYGDICNKAYYDKAFKVMEAKIKDPVFLVFSDDEILVNELLYGKSISL